MQRTYRERELELELSRRFFDFGRVVLGKDSGGMIAKLKNAIGEDAAWNALKDARLTSEPKEYVGAIIRDRAKPSSNFIFNEKEYLARKAKYDAKMARTA